MKTETIYEEARSKFAKQAVVTIAAGASCAYLGDERNLREFLVADETARQLRRAGHTVFSLLIDDSFDPLTPRQLRVAVNKEESLVAKHQDWCGKPIGLLPDPFGCHPSFAAHFEAALLDRLNQLGCHFTLVSTIHLYERGLYAPYVQIVLERHEEIRQFLDQRFRGYQPEKLFWPLCPDCGYIDETRVEGVQDGTLTFYCGRCEQARSQKFADVKGKLNWKLDCAARWALFHVDAEPFNKAYLEPTAGAFVVAQTLCQEFFGGHSVLPLRYGLIKMDKQHSYKLLAALPPDMLRAMMVDRASTDLTITQESVVHAAARYEVMPGTSFRSAIDQLLPGWLLTPETLSPHQRSLVAHGIAFSEYFLDAAVRLQLPKREHFAACDKQMLQAMSTTMDLVSILREDNTLNCADFSRLVQTHLGEFGEAKADVVKALRRMLGQERGLPVGRVLYMLPKGYVALVTHMLELSVLAYGRTAEADTALLAA